MYVCMYENLYVCMHENVYVCMYVCMYVCIYILGSSRVWCQPRRRIRRRCHRDRRPYTIRAVINADRQRAGSGSAGEDVTQFFDKTEHCDIDKMLLYRSV